jgi:putative hydrolase of the HAD superfamily
VRISPKAVIFDYGNVLCESQPPADTQALANILGLPVPRFSQIYWQFRVEFNAAALDPSAYWNTIARTASRTITPAQISELIEIDSRSWSHPAPVMPQWARDLRAAGIRTALLSNMPVPRLPSPLRVAPRFRRPRLFLPGRNLQARPRDLSKLFEQTRRPTLGCPIYR